ncbi:MAG: hypothetical protein JWN78_2809 [Bacteroidota bacterium]|nr:hypothetical protein [Bacteroidota bacterium]
MIELDELKHIWKDKIDSSIDNQHMEQEKIRELLTRRSSNIIDKLRRNLRIEICMFFACLLLIACVPFYFHSMQVTILCIVVSTVIFFPYLVYYIKKYSELKKFFSYNSSIKVSLQALVLQLEKYLDFYFWGSLLLTPVSVFLSGFAILYEMKALGFLLYFNIFNSAILATLLSFALLLTLISYPLMKWYIRKLYGQHLEKLKDCLKELQEADSIA